MRSTQFECFALGNLRPKLADALTHGSRRPRERCRGALPLDHRIPRRRALGDAELGVGRDVPVKIVGRRAVVGGRRGPLSKIGEKIRVSGGGRCNFTNIHYNPDFCCSALARYTPHSFIALVEKYGIPYHEKKLGQLFCDESSQGIIDLLRTECDVNGVDWLAPCNVSAIEKTGASWAYPGKL